MKKLLIFATIIAAPATGETLCFDAEDGFTFIRCVSVAGKHASCEVLSNPDTLGTCVALDATNKLIASSGYSSTTGTAIFQDLDAATIARVICRSN